MDKIVPKILYSPNKTERMRSHRQKGQPFSFSLRRIIILIDKNLLKAHRNGLILIFSPPKRNNKAPNQKIFNPHPHEQIFQAPSIAA